MPDPDTATTAAPKLFFFSAAARIDACEAVAQSWETDLDDEIRESAIAAVEALEPHVERIVAEARADERQRMRSDVLDGDPSALESRLRQFLDDEDAADACLVVADLLDGDAP